MFRDVPVPEFIKEKLIQDDHKQQAMDEKIEQFRVMMREKIAQASNIASSSSQYTAPPQVFSTDNKLNSVFTKLAEESSSFFNRRTKRKQPEVPKEPPIEEDNTLYQPLAKRPHGSTTIEYSSLSKLEEKPQKPKQTFKLYPPTKKELFKHRERNIKTYKNMKRKKITFFK